MSEMQAQMLDTCILYSKKYRPLFTNKPYNARNFNTVLEAATWQAMDEDAQAPAGVVVKKKKKRKMKKKGGRKAKGAARTPPKTKEIEADQDDDDEPKDSSP